MAGLNPHPPSVLHHTTRLTHTEAHARLSAFLENAENEAAYRPDSTLTERGPQSASTGANPNLTLHHLQRILQGMEGRRVGGGGVGGDGDEDVGRFFGEGARLTRFPRKRPFDDEQSGGVTTTTTTTTTTTKGAQVDHVSPENQGRRAASAGGKELDGWQDKEDYDLAQQDEGVNALGDERHPGAHLEEPVNAAEAEEMTAIEVEDTGQKLGLSQQRAGITTADKAARKEAKRLRQKQMKRQKEEAKAKK